MKAFDVTDTGKALAYITDCTLATVCDMAMKRNRPAYRYARQISIAQMAINWGVQMGVDFSQTRAVDVLKIGTVAEWAKGFEP